MHRRISVGIAKNKQGRSLCSDAMSGFEGLRMGLTCVDRCCCKGEALYFAVTR